MFGNSRVRLAVLLAMVVAVCTVVCVRNTDADSGHHEGTFIGAVPGKIAILNRDMTATEVFPLADLVTVTRNGFNVRLSDLQRGDLVQMLTETRLRVEFVVSIAATARP